MEIYNSKCKDLSAEKILSFLDESDLSDIFVFETINSTNTFSKELAKNGAKHKTLVIANQQTMGRGRLGRDFFSPPDTGLYMSIILCPELLRNSDPSALTIIAGVAVCRVLETICDKNPKIKWVNDIFLEGKKVCGILAEAGTDSNRLDYVIVGIGLNISTQSFPGELNKIAGSINQVINRSFVAAEIIKAFNQAIEICNSDQLIEEYKSYSMVLGKKISFTINDKTYEGIATDINIEGNLIVCLENGDIITLKSGEVSLESSNFVSAD